jgi:phenylacetate-CoA ligase
MEDYFYKLKNIYSSLPTPVRMTLGYLYGQIPLGIRYGKSYSDMYHRLLAEELYSSKRNREIQTENLKNLLKFCSENVPYYSRIFAEHGINIQQVQTIDDFKKYIPFTLKTDIQANNKAFISTNLEASQSISANTGGSTGIPLQLYYQKHVTRSIEHAFFHNLWRRVDYKHGDPVVVLRGFSIPQANDYWFLDKTKNRLVMSSYHLNIENIPRYINKICKFKPKYFHVYPSALSIIAKYMDNHKISFPFTIKAILAGSETIIPHQRKLLEETFKCRLFSWYGQGEMVALGGECEFSNEYHFFPRYGFVELEKDDSTKKFEIFGTSFVNPAMPLIRYKTGDIAEISDNRQCKCGRNHFRIKRVLGRMQEMIVTKSKSIVTLTGLVFGLHHEAFKNIRRLQIEQSVPGEIIIRIDKMDSFTTHDENEMAKSMLAAVSGDLEIDFEYSHELSLTPMGKHKLLIQKLNLNNFM